LGRLERTAFFIISGRWIIFYPKDTESRGEVLLHLYYSESCFWAKPPRAFKLFGWLLAFVKVKASWKAQPNTPYN
jgi:hypothetical protein